MPSVDEGARLVVRTDEGTVLYPLAARSLAEGTSTVTCRGEGIWCPEIAVRGDGDPLTLPVFRSMTLTGLLAGRVATPVTEGTVQGVVRKPDGRVVAEVNDDLAVTDRKFSFTGPRMPLDLRFAFEHAAPVYRWVPEPGAGGEPVAELAPKMDLGVLNLRPGGSVSGWTYGRDDDLPLAGAEVAAFPATSDRVPTALRTVRSTSDERGFFQLHGLEAGFYRVEIQSPDRVAEVLEPVAVEAASETVVGKVLLAPPLTLAVHVDPSVHPDGTPWKIILSALDQRDDEAPTVVRASDDGFAEVERMRPTRYRVDLGRELGESLHRQTLDLVGDETVTLRVPVAQVTGHVRLGGEPIVATVVLEAGNTDRVEVEIDEDGRLDGWMRRPERPWLMATVSWREGDETRRRLVEVVPTLDDDLVEVEIELPAGSVYGSVVDSEGNPRSRVRVL
ncbi:MAG TPA: carboxypeptidase-like regulatory domain-containing protein, partial [Thermoanaerobaculia bacterium]|nr:carboxypeptidase-like regulatory domain-containing protein [Thermoanaerobaculia bacterium]